MLNIMVLHYHISLSLLLYIKPSEQLLRVAMADKVVLNRTNTELLAPNTQKKQQEQCIGIQYDSQDYSCFESRRLGRKKTAS